MAISHCSDSKPQLTEEREKIRVSIIRQQISKDNIIRSTKLITEVNNSGASIQKN
jgi:hypothetical protein